MVCTGIIVSSTWIFVKAKVIGCKGVETYLLFFIAWGQVAAKC